VTVSAENRAVTLGRLSLSYGLGHVVGSLLSGLLVDQVGITMVAMVASALSFSAVAANAVLLSRPKAAAASEAGDKSGASSGLQLSKALAMLKAPHMRLYMLFQILVGVAVSVYYSQSTFAVTERLHVEPSALAFIQAAGAIVGVVTNLFLLDLLMVRLGVGEVAVVQIACLLFASSFIAFIFASSVTHLYLMVLPLGIGSGLWYTVTTSMVTRLAGKEVMGTAIGFVHASRAFCGIVAPVAGGYLIKSFGPTAIGAVPAGMTLLAILLLPMIGPAAGALTQAEGSVKAHVA